VLIEGDRSIVISDMHRETRNRPTEDQEDYAQLRRDLVKAVQRVCPSWMSDRSDDLVQVALIRVMEIQRKSEGKSEFSAFYLKKAAYSAMIDEIRRLRRRQETTLDDEENPINPPAESPDPERATASREVGRAIRDCLGGLIPPRRHAVTLHLQGHSVPDVGRRLGWTAKKAENLVYRGLADLRGCLDSKGVHQ
jgi:RNA polymerase sigma-70 factor (ECF subfamily)